MSQERMLSNGDATHGNVLGYVPNVEPTLVRAQQALDKVHVVHGCNEGYFPLAGKTIGQVRKSLREVYNIGGDAVAMVNGQEVGDDYILSAGVSCEFSKACGTKGLGDL